MQAATRGRGEGANHLTGDFHLVARLVGVGRQRGREQRLRIEVERLIAQLHCLGHLDYLSKVHDRDAVADMRHGGEVVADKQVADAAALASDGTDICTDLGRQS